MTTNKNKSDWETVSEKSLVIKETPVCDTMMNQLEAPDSQKDNFNNIVESHPSITSSSFQFQDASKISDLAEKGEAILVKYMAAQLIEEDHKDAFVYNELGAENIAQPEMGYTEESDEIKNLIDIDSIHPGCNTRHDTVNNVQHDQCISKGVDINFAQNKAFEESCVESSQNVISPLAPPIIEELEVEELVEKPTDPRLKRFSGLMTRSSSLAVAPQRDPLGFYADLRLSPIKVDSDVYQVLSSTPGLDSPNFKWVYTVVYHGRLTHSWSLLNASSEAQHNNPISRPIATLETSGRHFGVGESVINDYVNVLEAKSIKLVHYHDSWSNGGKHIGFQADDDYRYEWQKVEYPPGSKNYDIYLWRINLHDPSSVLPAGRIVAQELIQDPMLAPNSKSKKPLWCVEFDKDRVSARIALLSALSLKITRTQFHAWFAPKHTVIPRPMPLINFAFQDEGHVFQRSQKFWGDWEDPRGRSEGGPPEEEEEDRSRVLLVRVFNKAYLKQFAILPEIIEMLNNEAAANANFLKRKYAVY